MDLYEEYKEFYYKEMESEEKLNSKLMICFTFLTILGSALILIWTQIKSFEYCWYTWMYIAFCAVAAVMFGVCIVMFFRAYTGYQKELFPIEACGKQNKGALEGAAPEQEEEILKALKKEMGEAFFAAAAFNQQKNCLKNKRHYKLIRMIMATFVVVVIAYSISIVIGIYESKQADNHTEVVTAIQGETTKG